MSSRQSLFYIAALLTGHVSAAGTTVKIGGFGSPSGIDKPKKTAPAMINDMPKIKSTPTVVEEKIDKDETSLKNDEKVIERRLGNSFGRLFLPQEEEAEQTTPEIKCCCICLSNITENGATIACYHTFHKECLSELKASDNTKCPECREPVKDLSKSNLKVRE